MVSGLWPGGTQIGSAYSPEMALILKRAPIGDNQEDYDVHKGGINRQSHLLPLGGCGRGPPWMWASSHNADAAVRTATSRPMAAFAKSWRRGCPFCNLFMTRSGWVVSPQALL
jgi:hypothetical protein